MKINNIHEWNLNTREARSLQLRLQGKIRRAPLRLRTIGHVAGADIAISKTLNLLVGLAVVMTFPSLEIVEVKTATAPIVFPYVPGLLSFREIPVLLDVFASIETPFEVLLCDGQGIAHPRQLGLASHLGLFLETPTIGCAKSRLVGEWRDVGSPKGSFSPLMYKGTRVGSVLRTREGTKPIFISPGHLVDIASSRRIVLACTKRYRIPEPTRQAHIMAGKQKKILEVESMRRKRHS